jgi:ABC-2 type transport system permease protein
MRKILAVAFKELKQIRRDPLTLAMLLGIPAMMLLLFGYALSFDVRHVPLAVEDRSRTEASRTLVSSFVNSTYFDQVEDLAPGTDYLALFQQRSAWAVLVIPESFATDRAAARRAPVQLVLDGADASTATTVLGYAQSLVSDLNIDLAARALARGGLTPELPLSYEPRVWYNPELKSSQFLIPGLIGFILMITAVLSTALAVVREKERGTMEQLHVTALRPIELILGKTLPYLVISLLATVVIVVAARALFGVVVQGSYLDLFIVTLVYLVGALGLGLLVSSAAHSQAEAFQSGALIATLPAIFLSGFIFPIRSMPHWLQAITYAVPARYYLIITRGVILKGAGLAPFARDMAFLAVFAVVVLLIAYARLTRR